MDALGLFSLINNVSNNTSTEFGLLAGGGNISTWPTTTKTLELIRYTSSKTIKGVTILAVGFGQSPEARYNDAMKVYGAITGKSITIVSTSFTYNNTLMAVLQAYLTPSTIILYGNKDINATSMELYYTIHVLLWY